MAKRELLASAGARYQEASRKDKRRILGEFIMISDHHREHIIRPLSTAPRKNGKTTPLTGRRLYGEAIPEAELSVQEIADHTCGEF